VYQTIDVRENQETEGTTK